MPQVINTNIMSINAQRSLNKSQLSMQTSLERLSSGLRINRAKDDAAGLALAAGFETDMRSNAMKIRNAGDGISFAQAGEAALAEIQNMAQRISELKVQRTNAMQDSSKINLEIAQLLQEISVQRVTTFNDVSVVNGSVTIDSVTVGGVSVAAITSTNAETSIDTVATARATYGAQVNRLEAKVRYYEASYESNAAAKSRVMDADFAMETANLTRTQILQQAGAAMLAQANSLPQNVLTMLR